jgi:hypothetical protein
VRGEPFIEDAHLLKATALVQKAAHRGDVPNGELLHREWACREGLSAGDEELTVLLHPVAHNDSIAVGNPLPGKALKMRQQSPEVLRLERIIIVQVRDVLALGEFGGGVEGCSYPVLPFMLHSADAQIGEFSAHGGDVFATVVDQHDLKVAEALLPEALQGVA